MFSSAYFVRISYVFFFALLTVPPLAAATEVKLELEWNELSPYVAGRRLTIGLVDGSRLDADVIALEENSLQARVYRSNSSVYEKGNVTVRRVDISVFRYGEMKGKWRALATAIGAGAGALAGGIIVTRGNNEGIAASEAAGAAALVVGAGAGIGYALGRGADKRNVTLLLKRPTTP